MLREIRRNELSPVGSRCVSRIRLHCSTVHQTKHSANNLSGFVIPAIRTHRTPAACPILMREEQLNATGRSFRRGSYSTESPSVVQHHPQSLTVQFIFSILTVKIPITYPVFRNASVVIWASNSFDAIICKYIILIDGKNLEKFTTKKKSSEVFQLLYYTKQDFATFFSATTYLEHMCSQQ